ncbi:hypothetical protein RIF23_00385 [Lipingzhangella sp. LS1_29]|uniref:Uncharacterized protein n=1 Tax=Lipingzhangella rawalii TaxID=2055835 RepID=A0ABU2H1P0_9ACTN|nr:hypothetical protein [Lipingzhangella rawalii]MDS1268745.1 hypothetical protein [Lipingzhangella rawalii]
MVTEVITRKYCDPHAVHEERVEATDVIQFAFEGAIREVDACAECKKDYDARIEPLVDFSRPVKKRRKTKSDSTGSGSQDQHGDSSDQGDTAAGSTEQDDAADNS